MSTGVSEVAMVVIESPVAVPVGFESLSEGARRNIREYAGTDDLATLTILQLEALLQGRFSDPSLLACIPDRGNGIRSALARRIELLRDSSRHTGDAMHGMDPDDVEMNLALLREAREANNGADSDPDEEFP